MKVAVVLMLIAVTGPFVVPAVAEAQTVAGTIAGSGSRWDDMALYDAGGKLFVDDVTGNRVLVYDARTLAYLTEISFSAYSPRYPMSLAIHQGTGTLYVALGTGSATNDTIIVPLNANTSAAGTNITGDGWDLSILIDQSRARLCTIGSKGLGNVLTAIDINTNTVAGTLNPESVYADGQRKHVVRPGIAQSRDWGTGFRKHPLRQVPDRQRPSPDGTARHSDEFTGPRAGVEPCRAQDLHHDRHLEWLLHL